MVSQLTRATIPTRDFLFCVCLWGVMMTFTIAALFAPFLILIISFLLLAYMAAKDIESIYSTFRNSRIVYSYLEGWTGSSIPSRCTPLLIVIGAVVCSRIHIARGDMLPEELDNLPRNILVRISWVAGLIVLSCIWILGLLVWGRYFK